MKKHSVKRYDISIEPPISPAEWFFHIRNIADEVYQLGYEMRDFHDADENGRQSILSAKKLDRFSGLMSHPEKALDQEEIDSRIHGYLKDRGYSQHFVVESLREPTGEELRLRDSSTLPIDSVDGEMTHYSIEFAPAITPAEWFFHVRNMAELLAIYGYNMRDFRDGFVLDRELILEASAIDFFEGFIDKDGSINLEEVWNLVDIYLKKHGLTLEFHRAP